MPGKHPWDRARRDPTGTCGSWRTPRADPTCPELIPATAAQQHEADHARAEGLRRQLAQAQTAIKALIAQVEKLGASTRPADIAYCDRLREQFSARHDEQTAIEAELHAIEDTQPVTDDITLIDELPYAPGLLARAPDHLREAIAAAFDMQATYRPDRRQATVILTITDATPGIITALTADPRTDNDTAAHTPPRLQTSHLPL